MIFLLGANQNTLLLRWFGMTTPGAYRHKEDSQMAADTFDPVLGLILQATGNNNNNWGTTFNNSVTTPGARAIAGVNTITDTSGTVDLSTTVPPAGLRLDIDHIQLLNGTLTDDVTVKVPNVSKTWWFENDTSGAFNVYVQVPSGTSPNGLIQIPQGCGIMVMCDGNGNLRRHDRAEVGSFRFSGKTAAGPGELACDGASYLKADFPDLYSAIGTTWGSADSLHFNVPNLIDTNRFLRAADGTTLTVGTYQSNQNLAHTHAVTGAPTAGTLGTDTQGSHTHALSDPGHNHVIGFEQSGDAANAGAVASGDPQYIHSGTSIRTHNATTGISVNTAACSFSTSIGERRFAVPAAWTLLES